VTSDRLVVHGGPILTLDPGLPRASSLVAREGRVVEVRPPGAPPPVPEAGERRIDLAGGALVPGFWDAHTHLVHWGLQMLRPRLGEARSAAGALEIMARHHRSTPGDRPLIGEGWDESGWSRPVFPGRDALDAIDRNRPLVMRRICGHMAVANSAALARIPPGPQVDVGSGLLVEDAAMGLARVFPPSPEELDEALEAAQRSYLAMGITAVHDMSTADHLKAYARAEARGTLRLHVASILTRPHLDILAGAGLGAGWRRGHLRLLGVKFFADGSLGARTAALREPYSDAPQTRGLLLLGAEELARAVRTAEEAGIPLAVHAIGDRAVDIVLDAFEAGLPADGGRAGHRVEHLEMIDPAGIARMKRLGLCASVQPNFIGQWGHPGGLYETRLGAERAAAMNPFRALLDAGVRLIFGSDAMPAGVLPGLAATVEAPHPLQRLAPEEALAAATREAALAAGDQEGGVLAPGCRADAVILDHDPAAATRSGELKVLATLVAGRPVCGPPEAESANASPVSG
jgi:hypothetical protein